MEKKHKAYLTFRIFSSLKVISLIYLIWALASYGAFFSGNLFSVSIKNAVIIDASITAGFIFFASFITLNFIHYVESQICGSTPVRLILLGITAFIFFACYLTVVVTGFKSNIIYCISTANLIVFACLIGNWITIPVKRAPEIIPLCVVVALCDLFSVFSGPTKHMVEGIIDYYEGGMAGTPPFVDFLLVKIPLSGSDTFVPLFGVSDWIIIAFLIAAAKKFNLNDNIIGRGIDPVKKLPRLLFFPIASAGLCFAIVVARGMDLFIPALPFVVVLYLCFMVIKYPEIRKLTKAELVPMAAFSAVIISLMIII